MQTKRDTDGNVPVTKKKRKSKEEKRFDEVLKIMLNTPPQPTITKKKSKRKKVKSK